MERNWEGIRKIWMPLLAFVLFFGIWAAWVPLHHLWIIADIIDGIFGWGDLIWLGCGTFLICWNRKRLSIHPKKMFCTAPKAKVFYPMLAIVLVYYLAADLLQNGGFYLHTEQNIATLAILFLIVGLQEELLFRGYFLNALAAGMPARGANLLSAFFFAWIHVPGWIRNGMAPLEIVTTGGMIFLLGLFFGWAFRKSGSIWTPVLLHTVWDVCTRLI
ncbi:CPBP family intramembrane glutamic endopeptidase [Anaeromassilibacillus senegalensis]|uniref:CPBP family intramembrane glutamic endopeptidase n=1 Tax=Anaeromassilibacillus senegalensis TaxID=1673717 RepID=UPI0006833C07|nr:type II CAAX endopeptidase family protein [Anaeromassilibacillus senegalensis]